MFEVQHASPRVGSIIRTTKEDMVKGIYAAYEDLPEEDKKLIADLRARRCLESTQRMINPDPTYAQPQRWQAHTARFHPLIWHHRSGEKSLLIGVLHRGHGVRGRSRTPLSPAGIRNATAVRVSPQMVGR
jgi:hypothetical protein